MNKYKYDLSFRIKHPYLDPEDICSTLGLQAKHKWKAGNQRRTQKGGLLKGKYQETYCCFNLVYKPNFELVDYIALMNSKLKVHKKFLDNVRATGGMSEYFIGMYFDRCSGEIFDFTILAELADLKIDLSLDLYGNP